MARGLLPTVWAVIAACFFAALTVPAAAADGLAANPVAEPQAICFTRGSANRDLQHYLSSTPNWACSGKNSDLSAEQVIVRIPITHGIDRAAPELPRYIIGRNGKFRQITIIAADRDGSLRQRKYTNDQVQPGLPKLRFSAELPPVSRQTEFIYVAVDGALQPIFAKHLHLAEKLPGNTQQDRNVMLLLAMLCGVIIMPLVFNLAFFRILREQFLLWHAVLSVCAVMQIVLSAGIFSDFADLTLPQMRIMNVLSFGGMMVAASMFAASFIEADKLSPRLRQGLRYGAIWCGFITLVHLCEFTILGRYSADLFYIGCASMLPLFTAVMWSAARRGSRAVWFQIVGWAPLYLTGIVRATTYFIPQLQHSDAYNLFHIGVIIECVATALGVVDRFMILRRQCDDALSQARQSEALSERDHLTGLMNRRAIEPRFAQLRSMGFNTFALIDLDRFKSVNDTYGHALGDEVLQAVAQALDADENVLAMRLGGEEFVLLLRGKDTHRMAEQRRMAIPTRTAVLVPGLDRMVTASMGVVEMPEEGLKHASFDELYSRADKLLYEAKEAGRNRALFEKLVAFPDRRGERRPGKAVAA